MKIFSLIEWNGLKVKLKEIDYQEKKKREMKSKG
jgi:hypothetical protein